MLGRRYIAKRQRMSARVIALLLASTAFVQQAVSAPADIFMSSAPVIGAPSPKARELKDGDASVSTQTGALNYSYPIQVPPGRNGLAPQLALTYTSQGAVHGTIASGWSFPIPEIREDTSQGRLATRTVVTGDARADDRFMSSLAGQARLVKVPIAAAADVYAVYLAQGDSSGTRYERLVADVDGSYPNGYWRVRTLDGTTMLFGEPSRTAYAAGWAPCTHVSEDYAPLTTVRDAFGNEVRYEYSPLVDPNECVLRAITWGYNAAAGVTGAFAKVEFSYNDVTRCSPGEAAHVGAQLDYRSGRKILTGASNLLQIRVTAFPVGIESSPTHTRTIDLAYSDVSEQCNRSHAPVRLLKSIEERAWGTNAPLVTLPKVTFDYSSPTVSLTTDANDGVPWNNGYNPHGGNYANLGWGRRPNPGAGDHWPTVEAMMIDFDGDGLPDRLTNSSSLETCSFSFQRNKGTVEGKPNHIEGFETQESHHSLPRLRWHKDSSASGSPAANLSTPDYEHCALNGQVTSYRNTLSAHTTTCHDLSQCQNSATPGLQGHAFCYSPGEFGLECPGLSTVDGTYRTYLAYRWLDVTADGLPDLVAAVHGNIRAYDIVKGGDSSQSTDSTPFGVPWPPCPSEMDRCEEVTYDCGGLESCDPVVTTKPCHEISTAPYSIPGSPSPSGMQREPYQRCEGLYPWIIYPNTGGALSPIPIIKYSPVPLESDTGDSNLGGPSITASEHMIADVDGDGILDVATLQTGAPWWQVWRGDGTGGFEPTRYSMSPRWPQSAFFSIDAPNTNYGAQIQTASGLVDLNGDGLSEHWLLGFSSTNISWANGTGFDTIPGSSGGLVGTFDISEKPGQDSYFSANDWEGTPPRVAGGTLTSKRRMVDVDHDGRVDIVDFSTPEDPRVRFNTGADFLGLVAYPGDSAGAVRRVESFSEAEDGNRPWELRSDLIDLDGDGIAESASTTSGLSRNYHSTENGPPRLLRSITNGRGATTTITYASMHDTTAVIQSPGSQWPDGRPKATPVNQWVVKSVRTVDQFSGANSTTTQFYKHPRHGANDEGRFAFRGFEEVRTYLPTGAQTVEVFDYATDWSGRLVESRVHHQSDIAEVRTIDRTTWVPRTLFAGAHTAYHASGREHFTCANGQTSVTCTATAAPAYTKTEIKQTPYSDSLQEILWADTESVLQAGSELANGDRRTVTTYSVVSTPTEHKLRPEVTTREHRVAGAWAVFGKTEKQWDSTLRVIEAEKLWLNSNDVAITRFEHDMTTGNLRKRWKPDQTNTYLELAYDAKKLFATTETNELGHVRNYTFEYGTGTKLVTTGPNVSTCGGTCPVGAPPGSICVATERYETKIDGLGRPLEQWDTVSDDGCTMYFHKRAMTSYVDAIAPTTPNSVTEKMRIDATASTWTEKRTDVDGLGRPIKETVFVQGTAPADQISTYTYASQEGWLTAVEVPDPSVNSAARVQHLYTYDTLGRPRTIRRPDSTTPAQKSGVDITYDGVTKTTTDVVGVAGGNMAGTKTITDRFGRLVQVQEQTASSTWQTTAYTYGPDDLVASIVDPQSVTTLLQHDFAGRRTRITRGTREWKYTYSKNGNLASEQVPGSNGEPASDLAHTTSIAYDDLDRPLQKLIGQRNLSSADQVLFGGNVENFYYDQYGNMLGKLYGWESLKPSLAEAAVSETFRANAQNQRYLTTNKLQIAGYVPLERYFYQTFYLFGGSRTTHYYDQVGAGTQSTQSIISYDARGLPSSIQLITPASNTNVGVQTRNVAGLVTKRRSTLVPGGSDWVESNWTYDQLGRVSSQVVQKGPTTAAVARQDLAYFGNDNPKQVTHYLGTNSKVFNYTYDWRHQLLSAASTTAGYFSGTYTYGNAGRLATANESQTINPLPAGTEVKPRNVNYVYGGTDPEQVTSLTNVSGGATYASLTYDPAGNMTAKCTGGQVATCTSAGMEKLEYVYDGKDQLRRVTRKLAGVVTGSEEYWYGMAGNRISIVKRDAGGAKTEMIWFIGDTQAHYDASGAVTHVYSNVSLGTPVARVDRTADTVTTTEYQFHGLANSTLATVSSNGTINTSFRYSPWGDILESTNAGGASSGTAAHLRRHNDKYVDEVSSLIYYGARYYDRVLVGWTQADPMYLRVPDLAQMSSPRRASLYAYTLQNPLRYVDPDGRNPRPSLGTYRSELEIRNSYRAALEADSDWTMKFASPSVWGLPPIDIGCGGGLTSMGSGICGLSQAPPGVPSEEDFDPGRKLAESVLSVADAAVSAGGVEAVESIIEDGKDAIPVVGTYRAAARGEIVGTVVSAASDLLSLVTLGAPVLFKAAVVTAKAGSKAGKVSKAGNFVPFAKRRRGGGRPCDNCADGSGIYRNPRGYEHPNGGPELVCEKCFPRLHEEVTRPPGGAPGSGIWRRGTGGDVP